MGGCWVVLTGKVPRSGVHQREHDHQEWVAAGAQLVQEVDQTLLRHQARIAHPLQKQPRAETLQLGR